MLEYNKAMVTELKKLSSTQNSIMARPQIPHLHTLVSIALSLGLGIVAVLSTTAQVRSESEISGQEIRDRGILQVTFDPPNEGLPKNSAGGASRSGSCGDQSLTQSLCVIPLMPTSNEGLTVAERPTFLMYVPQTSAKEIFFAIKDENNRHHFQTKIPITGTSGIMSFTLPAEAPALEIEKTYQWSLILIGEQGLRPDSPGVEGQIRRVEINPIRMGQLEQMSPIERAALYGEDGIWFDTIGTLAQLRRSQPNDSTLAATWEELLSSVGLQEIATEPLLR